MSEDAVRPGWADEIRERRLRLCWSQKEMARQLELAADAKTRSTLPSRESIVREIRFHESGTHRPGALYAELYRRVWALQGEPSSSETEIPGDLLLLAWTVGRLDQRMDRRTLLQLAASTTAGFAASPAERLMKALSGAHRPDDTVISHLEARTRGLHRLEEHLPSGTLFPALVTHLNEVSALMESRISEQDRTRLAVLAGESAVLAAWFAWELGDKRTAAAHSRLARATAKHGDDPAIGACMTGYHSYMTGGDTAKSVRMLQNAVRELGDADPATRAWLLARLAEEAAALHADDIALNAIHEAQDVYSEADIGARPWTCFLDPGRFASMRLTVHSRLRREDDALAAMDEIGLHLGSDTEVKKLCVVKAEMALAQYRIGDVTEAVSSARSAFTATVKLNAPLGWERLDNVVTELRPARAQVARDFRAEYASTRPETTPPSLL
ncbi:XRE family transcriptional regulator [Actinocorallia sp. API 0066]|uniref:XRE family transcriptional regulator n=1 Tax=Actinocorallia sp. API 0066 TaxID=2896846 RepID=UPI001E415751|nr:XRE family transcriptional regulator [Actinocorallia sp. API 0066]MCD0450462.1 XRE family transcriptional regulator [Actinocorallia sp. API 0066]